MAGSRPSPSSQGDNERCRICYGAEFVESVGVVLCPECGVTASTYERVCAEVQRLRDAICHAIDVCEDAADMGCECTGYYRCNGCERAPAARADDAAEILRDAMAAWKPQADTTNQNGQEDR